ncbi:hypothetical protein BFJ71_g16782 [Fusarium oxysporum]|nr:hypothetical protein BFJ71_g16782 [Fusarium oxysporum]
MGGDPGCFGWGVSSPPAEEGQDDEGVADGAAKWRYGMAGGRLPPSQSLKQLLEQDFNKKIEAMKAEFQLEFTKLRDRMAEEVARATAQMAQELSQVRDQLTQVYDTTIVGSNVCRRIQDDTHQHVQPIFICGPIGNSRTGVLHNGHVQSSRRPHWRRHTDDDPQDRGAGNAKLERLASRRGVAVTRDGRNASRLRIMGRNEEEMQKIKTILEARKVPGARVLRDQLYPTKADSMNRMAVFDQEFNVLPGAMETLSQENEVQIAKVAWLSRKVNPKSYGSMVVYLTKSTDAKRLLQEHYFLVAGESAYTSVFEQITGPEQCYNCQELGHKAFSRNCRKLHPRRHE